MRGRIFRISLQGPGGLNKHTEWLIGYPRLVLGGNVQGFGLYVYIFCSARCSFWPIFEAPRTNTPRTTPPFVLVCDLNLSIFNSQNTPEIPISARIQGAARF